MVSVWVLLILAYVLYGRCRRRYHAVLKCLGIYTAGIHVSVCIVWGGVSVLTVLLAKFIVQRRSAFEIYAEYLQFDGASPSL